MEEIFQLGADVQGIGRELNRYLHLHRKSCLGGRKERLSIEKYGKAETNFLINVWWPAFGHFDYLHPEYEVRDFVDGQRYLDFAYLKGGLKLCIEIDGYGPHCRDIGRAQFSDQLMRQNHLVLDGWQVLRFSYDDITDKPRRCQQVVQQFLGKWISVKTMDTQHYKLRPIEREILRYAFWAKEEGVTPKGVCNTLGISDQTVRRCLKKLLALNLLIPYKSYKRHIHAYKIHPQANLRDLLE